MSGRFPTLGIRYEKWQPAGCRPPPPYQPAGTPELGPAARTDPSSVHRLAAGFSNSDAHKTDLPKKSHHQINAVGEIIQAHSTRVLWCITQFKRSASLEGGLKQPAACESQATCWAECEVLIGQHHEQQPAEQDLREAHRHVSVFRVWIIPTVTRSTAEPPQEGSLQPLSKRTHKTRRDSRPASMVGGHALARSHALTCSRGACKRRRASPRSLRASGRSSESPLWPHI